ncbi:uncharacterized protein YycO [Roseovarius sp. MBR-154]
MRDPDALLQLASLIEKAEKHHGLWPKSQIGRDFSEDTQDKSGSPGENFEGKYQTAPGIRSAV